MEKIQFKKTANEVYNKISKEQIQAQNALYLFCKKNQECLRNPIVFKSTGLSSSEYRHLVHDTFETSKQEEFQFLLNNLISVEDSYKTEVRKLLIMLREVKEFEQLIKKTPQIFMYPSLDKYLEALESKTSYESFGLIRNILYKLGL